MMSEGISYDPSRTVTMVTDVGLFVCLSVARVTQSSK